MRNEEGKTAGRDFQTRPGGGEEGYGKLSPPRGRTKKSPLGGKG